MGRHIVQSGYVTRWTVWRFTLQTDLKTVSWSLHLKLNSWNKLTVDVAVEDATAHYGEHTSHVFGDGGGGRVRSVIPPIDRDKCFTLFTLMY